MLTLLLHISCARSQADTSTAMRAMRPSSFLIKMKVNRQKNNLSQGVFLVSVFMTSPLRLKERDPPCFSISRRAPHATYTYVCKSISSADKQKVASLISFSSCSSYRPKGAACVFQTALTPCLIDLCHNLVLRTRWWVYSSLRLLIFQESPFNMKTG